MGHPVYRFGAVLRRLRNDAGLTILAAAEATGYGKYERWESGKTQVGGQYVATIADVFGVTEDLHLLVHAWTLDRLTPAAGEPSRTLDLDELRRHLRNAPEARVELGEHAYLVIESTRHIEVALLLLAARYDDQRVVVLPAAHRRSLPPAVPDVPTLVHLYGDTLADASTLIGRCLLPRGLDGNEDAIDVTLAPALAAPGTYEQLARKLDAMTRTPLDPRSPSRRRQQLTPDGSPSSSRCCAPSCASSSPPPADRPPTATSSASLDRLSLARSGRCSGSWCAPPGAAGCRRRTPRSLPNSGDARPPPRRLARRRCSSTQGSGHHGRGAPRPP